MTIAPPIPAPPATPRERLLRQIGEANGGTVFAFRDGEPRGHVVSITNAIVDETCTAADRAWALAEMLATLNPALTSDLVIGFWRDVEGHLFVDVGIIVAHAGVAHAVGRAFRQQAIAVLGPEVIRIEPVSPWEGASTELSASDAGVCPDALRLREERRVAG